ncbi:MAG: Formamidopyrimidine-DNA glycolase [Bacteroidetes bacterium]|nr:Formamidopyrimidine-DNA glycolase [Bacteroidota bacterium]
MPEGPSILILKEQLQAFAGKKVIRVEGNSKIDLQKMKGKKVLEFKSWGKHFLICFKGFYLRIHLLMFGTYRINERKEAPARLSLQFEKGEINFYTCSIQLFENDVNDDYDWDVDVLSEEWDPLKAEKALKKTKTANVCDALLNQEIFSGVGNIIKNEVLFRTKIHPKSIIGALPPKKLKELIKEASNYSFDFYEWKKIFELKKHWLIYKKKECPRCKVAVIKDHLGKGKRLTCFCDNCQVLYS